MKPIFAGLLFLASAFAQQQGFDVVSIKPSDPLSNGMHFGISPSGTFEAKGVTLLDLISQAYDVRVFQVVGASGWMGTDKYEIITKDETKSPSVSDLNAMNEKQRQEFHDRLIGKLQAMLADRFQLKLHREKKEMPVYALVIAKGGIHMEVSSESDDHDSGMNGSRTDEGKSSLTGKNLPMEHLVRFLSGQTARPVIDQTGLTEKYNFKMIYAPDMNDLTGPSIFTALQEQLGLKLESQKGPADVLVIDSVQKPSGN
jgi:uncharacterized protein (TIGR03435 family)